MLCMAMDFLEVNVSFLLNRCTIECVGQAYHYSKQQQSGILESTDSWSKEDTNLVDFLVDISYLKSLDPKEWKSQDHYAVLGLKKQRINATDDQIRRAYRAMVLQHHPDKRKGKGEEVRAEDDYFTCITKAYEILGTTKTRRAYDSVDPEFDDALPTQSEVDSSRFYTVFSRCFDLNARWSERQPVPPFGVASAERADVEEFYNFWYNFKSWREFSYMDEEDKEKGQDRDERRWIEKENKTARIKRKKEEMQRIRTLVDLAYNNDKRIQRFKNEEKEKKLATRRAKMDAAQAQKAAQEAAVKEAQLAKEQADRAEQKRIEQIRSEKEQAKKAVKRERKMLRDKAKECNYFTSDDAEMLKHLEGVEKICETFSLLELQELNKTLEPAAKEVFVAALVRSESIISAQLDAFNESARKRQQTTNASTATLAASSGGVREVKKNECWTNENVHLLIKAVNLFPAGTTQRWDVIAAFLNQHAANGLNVNARDVLSKAKALQSSDFSKNTLKQQANEAAFESFEKSKKDVQTCSDITLNMGVVVNGASHDGADENLQPKSVAAVNGSGNGNGALTNGTPKEGVRPPMTAAKQPAAAAKVWTKEEQALLEQAIRTYPISTPDRWDRIAECVPNRTKKECVRRVKEIVEIMNSKKEAQQAI